MNYDIEKVTIENKEGSKVIMFDMIIGDEKLEGLALPFTHKSALTINRNPKA